MADTLCYMSQYLKKKGPILNKEAFVTAAKDVISNGQSVTQFIRVIANHCLDKHCAGELSLIVEQILTITNQLSIISSVNAVTPGCKSSDEILVKNAQNLLQTVLRGVHAAETACITWRRKLEIHRARYTSNPETDELGLRKTSTHPVAPSLAPPVGFNVLGSDEPGQSLDGEVMHRGGFDGGGGRRCGGTGRRRLLRGRVRAFGLVVRAPPSGRGERRRVVLLSWELQHQHLPGGLRLLLLLLTRLRLMTRVVQTDAPEDGGGALEASAGRRQPRGVRRQLLRLRLHLDGVRSGGNTDLL
ncbi:Vinculin [Liparis tanakae]|uniref:Vinculin n=1 Tax=Liparis tanakae TaxID=230148 RepID=A0A4Z2H775_9TELE|nr:Vinculin [Liparis tanakae]